MPLTSDPGVFVRCHENTTSSASNVSPPWNLTPWRSVKRHTVGDSVFQDVASAGSISSLSLKRTSDS